MDIGKNRDTPKIVRKCPKVFPVVLEKLHMHKISLYPIWKIVQTRTLNYIDYECMQSSMLIKNTLEDNVDVDGFRR
jgi:hypothetical protein